MTRGAFEALVRSFLVVLVCCVIPLDLEWNQILRVGPRRRCSFMYQVA